MSLIKGRRKYFKREARNIIFADWLTQIIAFVVVGAVFIGVSTFGIAEYQLVLSLNPNSSAAIFLPFAFYVAALLLIIPMMFGVMNFEICAFERKNAKVSDIFSPFSEVKTINRSYMLFVSFVARLCLPFAFPVILLYFINFYYYSGMFGIDVRIGNADVIYFALNAVFVVLCLAALVYCAKYFAALYIAVKRKDLAISKCFYLASVCMHGKKYELFLLTLSFAPLLVLSLFTMGFLFILYTLPYIVLSFVGFSSYAYMYEMNVGQTNSMLHSADEENKTEIIEKTSDAVGLHLSESNEVKEDTDENQSEHGNDSAVNQ